MCVFMCVFAASPTTAGQINLVNLRSSSLTNQDTVMDMCNEGRLRNSCVSLDEKTRIMSRSASFRDGFEEGEGTGRSDGGSDVQVIAQQLWLWAVEQKVVSSNLSSALI